MSQAPISTYFPSRKRVADCELQHATQKVFVQETVGLEKKLKKATPVVVPVAATTEADVSRGNLVNFLKKGFLSPNKHKLAEPTESTTPKRKLDFNDDIKKATPKKATVSVVSEETAPVTNYKEDCGYVTPKKNIIQNKFDAVAGTSYDSIRNKIKNHQNVNDFKTRVQKLKEKFDSLKDKTEANAEKTTRIAPNKNDSPKLKQFDTVQIEYLSPTKFSLAASAKRDEIVTQCASPPSVSKRLFSPVKSPAYKRFQSLVDTEKARLPLPHSYEALVDTFRAVDVICATLQNRNEKITFKRLKIAVQRMTKRNFTEADLGRIKTVFPGAMDFTIEKFKNFGSESKHETHQLIIHPKLATTSEHAVKDLRAEKRNNTMLLTTRYKYFYSQLVEKVKNQHLEFLKNSIDPPIAVDPNAIVRWHPDFNLNKCPQIPISDLPKPPQQSGFANAQQVLSKAKNLFAHQDELETSVPEKSTPTTVPVAEKSSNLPSNLVKGIPNSLLAKIKQKQAAKALNLITKTSSLDAQNTDRLVELTRHIKNIFVTEKKGVLPMELVLDKLKNSYGRTFTSAELMTKDLKVLTEKFPLLFSFEHFKKKTFFKCNRNADFNGIKKKLTKIVV